MADPAYKRILLKLSGEALMGSEDFGIDPKVLDRMALEVGQLVGIGVEVGLVIVNHRAAVTRKEVPGVRQRPQFQAFEDRKPDASEERFVAGIHQGQADAHFTARGRIQSNGALEVYATGLVRQVNRHSISRDSGIDDPPLI